MNIVINGITYTSKASSDAKLIEIPIEGQTPLPESQQSIDNRSYNLSTRNGANAYIIPTEAEKLYLNFIAQKVAISDHAIAEILQPKFEYFVDEILPEVEGFTLVDGIIFRCVDANSLPKKKEDYQYWIMMNGMKKRIPNYKTLEVMLIERGQTLLAVRVIEKNQCEDIPEDVVPISDKSGAWKEEYADATTMEALSEMENNAAAAGAIVEEAKSQAESQIEAVKAQAAADKAEAEAAKAEADAAKAASEAAIAEADAKKAEYESKINSGT